MAKLEFNSAHLWTANPVDGQPLDVSGYMSSIEATHDGEDKSAWADYLAGLPSGSMTISGLFDSHMPRFRFQVTPVTISVADGPWQRVKHWLRYQALRWYGWDVLSWLKVRYRKYGFDAEMQAREIEDEDGTGFMMEGRSIGPVTKGLEER